MMENIANTLDVVPGLASAISSDGQYLPLDAVDTNPRGTVTIWSVRKTDFRACVLVISKTIWGRFPAIDDILSKERQIAGSDDDDSQ